MTPTQGSREAAETDDSVKITGKLDKGLMNTEVKKEKERDSIKVTSLVADYSDSDSEPGQ